MCIIVTRGASRKAIRLHPLNTLEAVFAYPFACSPKRSQVKHLSYVHATIRHEYSVNGRNFYVLFEHLLNFELHFYRHVP